MVLLGRIELPTSPLPRVRSTTELQQRRKECAPIVAQPAIVNVLVALSLRCLSAVAISAKAFRMSEADGKNLSREERLALKLRENLRRRKAQARALDAGGDAGGSSESGESGLPKPGDAG